MMGQSALGALSQRLNQRSLVRYRRTQSVRARHHYTKFSTQFPDLEGDVRVVHTRPWRLTVASVCNFISVVMGEKTHHMK